jgi:hypothetical protein
MKMFPDLRSDLYASQVLNLNLLQRHTLFQRNTGGKNANQTNYRNQR